MPSRPDVDVLTCLHSHVAVSCTHLCVVECCSDVVQYIESRETSNTTYLCCGNGRTRSHAGKPWNNSYVCTEKQLHSASETPNTAQGSSFTALPKPPTFRDSLSKFAAGLATFHRAFLLNLISLLPYHSSVKSGLYRYPLRSVMNAPRVSVLALLAVMAVCLCASGVALPIESGKARHAEMQVRTLHAWSSSTSPSCHCYSIVLLQVLPLDMRQAVRSWPSAP